jgi:NitT/TauT family transport system permease protein
LLPAPSEIWQTYKSNPNYYTPHIFATGMSALGGILIGSIVGVGLAIAMVRYRWLERLLMPLIVIDQSVPKIAVAPLLIIWFGAGMASRIGIAVVIAFFPVIIGTLYGLRAIDRRLGRLMHTLSATWWNMLLKVRLPSAVPHIFSAIRIAVPLAITGAVVAEYVQANSGLGFVIMLSVTEYKTQQVFVCVALLSITCLALYGLVLVLERVLLGRRHHVLMKTHSTQ